MRVLMFAAREAQLLMKGEIDARGLINLHQDIAKQFAIKAAETYLIYDDQGGITVVIVFPDTNVRDN